MGMRSGDELDKDYRYPGDMWSAHRVRMIAACRAAGIGAIDGPFGDFDRAAGALGVDAAGEFEGLLLLLLR